MQTEALTIVDPLIQTELTKNHIEGSKAAMISAAFVPMAEMIRKFEIESAEIQKLEISPDSIQKARELRLRMVKVRTKTEATHKEQKAEFLNGGRAVDAVKNVLTWAIESEEAKMLKIEKHFENIEKEKKLKLFQERVDKLKPFIGEEAKLIPLAEMSEDSFNNLVLGYEAAKEQKEARERALIEENARIEEQKKAEQARIMADNERLRKENELRQKELREQTEKANAERAKIEAKLKKEREEKQRLERAEQERIAKEEAEKKRLAAEKRKAARQPDKVKLALVLDELNCEFKMGLKDSDAVAVATDIQEKFESFKKWAYKQIDSL